MTDSLAELLSFLKEVGVESVCAVQNFLIDLPVAVDLLCTIVLIECVGHFFHPNLLLRKEELS